MVVDISEFTDSRGKGKNIVFSLQTDVVNDTGTPGMYQTGGSTFMITQYELKMDPVDILLKKKRDGDANGIEPSLANAEFSVQYYPDIFTKISDAPASAERSWKFKPDTAGRVFLRDAQKISGDELYYSRTNRPSIPIGTIVIEETKAPSGYLINSDKYIMTFEIDDGIRTRKLYDANGSLLDAQVVTINIEQPVDTNTEVRDVPIRGGVKIAKVDKERNTANAQGDASLAGAEFTIYDNNNRECLTITTNASGVATTTNRALYAGKYTIKETKAPEGYLLDNKTISFEIKDEPAADGVIVDKSTDTVKDQVIRGGVELQKLSKETMQPYPQGGATLEGTEFTIYNNSAKSVLVNGVEYAKGEAVMTIQADANGIAKTGNKALPYGTYTAKETKAPEGLSHIDEKENDTIFTPKEKEDICMSLVIAMKTRNGIVFAGDSK